MTTEDREREMSDYAEIEQRLRDVGIQPTAQRIAICQYALMQSDHASVEEVKTWVDGHFPKVSLATVYNTLNLLVDAGLLKAIRLPESDKVRYDSNVSTHCHFLDEGSGELEDLDPGQVTIESHLPAGLPDFATFRCSSKGSGAEPARQCLSGVGGRAWGGGWVACGFVPGLKMTGNPLELGERGGHISLFTLKSSKWIGRMPSSTDHRALNCDSCDDCPHGPCGSRGACRPRHGRHRHLVFPAADRFRRAGINVVSRHGWRAVGWRAWWPVGRGSAGALGRPADPISIETAVGLTMSSSVQAKRSFRRGVHPG